MTLLPVFLNSELPRWSVFLFLCSCSCSRTQSLQHWPVFSNSKLPERSSCALLCSRTQSFQRWSVFLSCAPGRVLELKVSSVG
ncbi:hypothetical protein C8R48DRAFT_685640 [Suillus tomentosus]|nr:hypothetical protein C8R48DRAFT_685640 [Suillus tomentosus]